MLQAANTDRINPLILIAHYSECQNIQFLLQIVPIKVG